MSVIELRTMEIICSNLPEIVKSLRKIADSLDVKDKVVKEIVNGATK